MGFWKNKYTVKTSPYLAENLRKIRVQRELTLKQVAESVGVSLAYISALEKGVKKPSDDMFDNLCKLYSANKDAMLNEKATLAIVFRR